MSLMNAVMNKMAWLHLRGRLFIHAGSWLAGHRGAETRKAGHDYA